MTPFNLQNYKDYDLKIHQQKEEKLMLTFQKIIDFARSHKNEIVDHIKDITEWYEYEDIDVSVIVTISESLDTNGNRYLILSVDKESENLGFLRSVTLFSFYIDEDSRKYSRKKLLNEIEQELTAFENSIKAFDNQKEDYVTNN